MTTDHIPRIGLRVEAIDAAYDRLQVLWDVSLHVEPGELLALVGSNGAGQDDGPAVGLGSAQAGPGSRAAW
jgi:ABC-type branched-subunit amino acid transport system ATPase component